MAKSRGLQVEGGGVELHGGGGSEAASHRAVISSRQSALETRGEGDGAGGRVGVGGGDPAAPPNQAKARR
ncbi:MAG: hypothetical protein U1F77_11790 [Kiritimatiellia bacterium]